MYGTEGADEQYLPTPIFCGRPHEITLENKKKREYELDACYCAITNLYITKKKECSSQLPNNFLKEDIEAQKEAFGIPSDTIVSHATIRSRERRGQNRSKKGPVAPLANIEPALVAICLQMAFFRQPLNAKEGLLLMNSLIDRSIVVQENLIPFMERSNIVNKDAIKLGKVTKSWWAGFLDRHKDVLETIRGERIESSRANWEKLPFIVQMYDIIYSKMVDARVVTSIEEFFTNKTGEIVSKGEKYGRGNDIKITYPKNIYIFMDEIGRNTSQKKDGHNAGERKIVGVDNVPRSEYNSSDHHLTLLTITAATGEVIMCVVIFQSKQKEVPVRWQSGSDV